VAALSPDGVEIFADGEPVDRAIETVTWEADAAEKGGYEHYMRKEIHEQPESLRQTLAGRLDVDAGDVDLDVSFPPGFLADLEEIRIVACGTSYYAGRYAAQLFEDLAGCARPSRSPASTSSARADARSDAGGRRDSERRDGRHARGGASRERRGRADVRRDEHLGEYCHAGSRRDGVHPGRPEIGVAATKTFASQVATLAMLAVAVGRDRGALGAADARSG